MNKSTDMWLEWHTGRYPINLNYLKHRCKENVQQLINDGKIFRKTCRGYSSFNMRTLKYNMNLRWRNKQDRPRFLRPKPQYLNWRAYLIEETPLGFGPRAALFLKLDELELRLFRMLLQGSHCDIREHWRELLAKITAKATEDEQKALATVVHDFEKKNFKISEE